MKIVQTLWIPPDIKHIASFKSGWASAEYHWLSWTLSVLQLRQFYNDVELFTTPSGKQFVEELQLPYSKIELIDTTVDIPPSAWALAKILTYRQQTEPFIHVDGDVFLFKKLPDKLEQGSLICQSKELNFFHYENTLGEIQQTFTHVPPWCQQPTRQPLITYNAGIFGGSNLSFIKSYAEHAINFVDSNKSSFLSIQNSTAYCMVFEQYLFSELVRQSKKEVDTLFDEPVKDTSYPGLGDFWKNQNYLHLMGMSKKNRFILKQMMNKLRKDFPQHYYHVLRTCKRNNVLPEFKVYSTSDLDPLTTDDGDYKNLFNQFDPGVTPTDSEKIVHHYLKDGFVFETMEKFVSLDDEFTMSRQRFAVNNDVTVSQTDDEDPKFTLQVFDTFNLDTSPIPLEKIEFVILDVLKEATRSGEDIVECLIPYFDKDDVIENRHILENYVLDKIKSLLSYGAIRWVEFTPTYSRQREKGL